MDQGGIWALTGYLYQLLGTAVQAFHIPSKPHTDENSLDVLVYPETWGQDAVFSTPEQTSVIQFKHSNVDAEIEPAELYEICIKLHLSIESAKSAIAGMIVPCLYTNRRLSSRASKAMNAAKENKYDAELERVERRGKDGRKRYEGRSKQLNAIYKAILKDLRLVPLDFEKLNAKAVARCQQFGFLAHEWNSRLNQLVGTVLSTTVSFPRRLTLTDLDNALTNTHSPRLLCSPENAQHCTSAIETLKARMCGFQLLKRQSLEERILKRDEPLVVIEGKGGMGKSVLALLSIENYAKINNMPPPFTAFVRSSCLSMGWLQSEFAKWRNFSQVLPYESIDTVLNRLTAACPNCTQPILVIVVDGLDEEANSTSRLEVTKLLQHFADSRVQCKRDGVPPRAQLVITCRSKNELARGYLQHDFINTSYDECHVVSVGPFTPAEVAAIKDSRLPLWAIESLKQSQLNPTLKNLKRTRKIHPEVMNAILIPAVLGCLLSLPESEISAVLENDPKGLQSLGDKYIDWFSRKSDFRAQGLNKAEVTSALLAVIAHTGVKGGEFSVTYDWRRPIRDNGNQFADIILEEAISAGIINQPSRDRWYWENPICFRALAEDTAL